MSDNTPIPVPLHCLVKFRNGADFKNVEDPDGAVPVIGSGGPFARASDWLYDGESVLFGRKGTVDRPRHETGKFWTVDTMYYTELGPEVHGRWLYYWALTVPYSKYLTDTALPSMTSTTLGNLRVPWVPVPHQRRIADFLNGETAEIDAMAGELDRLMASLSERKKCLVDLAMLGDYPRVSLAWASSGIHTGPFGTQVKQADYISGGTPLINPSHIVDGAVVADERVAVGPVKARELVRHAMRAGDVVIGRRGEMGRCAVVRGPQQGWLCGTGSLRLVPNAALLWSDYAALVIASRDSRTQMLAYSVGATMDNLNEELLGRVQIPLPPFPEQLRIVQRLNKETALIDDMIADAQRLKALLSERRATLITEVVTGRKKVA